MVDFPPHIDKWHETIVQCAPNVGPSTLKAIMKVESNGNHLVVFDNGPAHLPFSKRKPHWKSYSPKTKADATKLVKSLLAKGHLLDVGLMQINSNNWHYLGLNATTVFEPCKNVAAAGRLLAENYQRAVEYTGKQGQVPLALALSAYNTGSFSRGSGYVTKVLKAAGLLKPGQTAKLAPKEAKPASPYSADPLVAF